MALGHKLVFTFDTDESTDFVFGVSNAKATPSTTDLEKVAQGIVDGNIVVPKKGSVTALKKIEQIATTTTSII